jgi:hypothetical protein
MRKLTRIALVVSLLAAPLAVGAAGKDKYQIRPTDNLRTILEQEIDMPVKLRLKSGQELSGTVVRLGNGVVQLSHIAGMEFYDAVISLDDISAVLFRVRQREQKK